MSKILIAYFSATGTTKKVAEKLAQATGGDLYEIKPLLPYSNEDLDWTSDNSRSSKEMNDRNYRPIISNVLESIEEYEKIYLGFPIWWYRAPTIINTFLESYDLTNKIIIPFATSGSSNMHGVNDGLLPSCLNAVLKNGKRFGSNVSIDELKKWVNSIK